MGLSIYHHHRRRKTVAVLRQQGMRCLSQRNRNIASGMYLNTIYHLLNCRLQGRFRHPLSHLYQITERSFEVIEKICGTTGNILSWWLQCKEQSELFVSDEMRDLHNARKILMLSFVTVQMVWLRLPSGNCRITTAVMLNLQSFSICLEPWSESRRL